MSNSESSKVTRSGDADVIINLAILMIILLFQAMFNQMVLSSSADIKAKGTSKGLKEAYLIVTGKCEENIEDIWGMGSISVDNLEAVWDVNFNNLVIDQCGFKIEVSGMKRLEYLLRKESNSDVTSIQIFRWFPDKLHSGIQYMDIPLKNDKYYLDYPWKNVWNNSKDE